MTQSAADIFFCNRSKLHAAAVAVCLALAVTMAAKLRGAEPEFERAEIWVGGRLVQPATESVNRDQRAVVYINGQRIDPLAPTTPTPAPRSPHPAPLPERPGLLATPPVEQTPIEPSGPLVIEFPTPGRYPAPAPATAPAPAAVPLPDEATVVAPTTPSLAARESSANVQPAILTVPQGATTSNVELTAGFSPAGDPPPIAPLAAATPPQAPELLPAVQQQTSWPVQPAPLFADAPSPRPHVGRTNLSPSIFFWPLVIGLVLVFFVQRMAVKKRGI